MANHIEIEGVQDTLRIYEDKLSITPRGVLGFLNKGLKGTKEIPFHSINAIQIKMAGALTNGYIQFTISGGNESKGGLLSAVGDENTFLFKKSDNETMEKAKQFIEEKIKSAKNPSSASVSKADELAKLASLKSSGAITEEEFQKLKAELLSKAG